MAHKSPISKSSCNGSLFPVYRTHARTGLHSHLTTCNEASIAGLTHVYNPALLTSFWPYTPLHHRTTCTRAHTDSTRRTLKSSRNSWHHTADPLRRAFSSSYGNHQNGVAAPRALWNQTSTTPVRIHFRLQDFDELIWGYGWGRTF